MTMTSLTACPKLQLDMTPSSPLDWEEVLSLMVETVVVEAHAIVTKIVPGAALVIVTVRIGGAARKIWGHLEPTWTMTGAPAENLSRPEVATRGEAGLVTEWAHASLKGQAGRT
mmetsp:Transcript_21712/g.51899  ORF Transcript_21712/g.51899 Transcript_21712/m.51899 type:complete len:114 (-) Transcript_21712:763-1104(-)